MPPGDILDVLVEGDRETAQCGVRGRIYGRRTCQRVHAPAVGVEHLGRCRESLVSLRGGVGDLDVVGYRVPEDVQRFAGAFAAPVGARQVVIVIIGLPYQRGVGRLSHPCHDAGGVLPHVVEPSFVEGLVRLDVQQLGLPAEVVDVRSLAVTLVEHPFVLVGAVR